MATEIPHKWQPVMLVVDHRIECACGSLAIFIVLNREDGAGASDAYAATGSEWGYTAWCQTCWANEQEQERDA